MRLPFLGFFAFNTLWVHKNNNHETPDYTLFCTAVHRDTFCR